MLQPNINIAKQQKSRWFIKRQGTEIIRTKQGKAFMLQKNKKTDNKVLGYLRSKTKIKSTVNKLISDEEIVSENNQEHYHDSGLQYFTPHRKSRQRKICQMAQYTSTRGHPLKQFKQRSRLNLRSNFFPHLIIGQWNVLPTNLVTAPSLNAFKGRIKKSSGKIIPSSCKLHATSQKTKR